MSADTDHVAAWVEISRPVMKAFKAMIRAEGLFSGLAENGGTGIEFQCIEFVWQTENGQKQNFAYQQPTSATNQ